MWRAGTESAQMRDGQEAWLIGRRIDRSTGQVMWRVDR